MTHELSNIDFVEVTFQLNPYREDYKDVLAALLADVGFDSFVEAENGLIAYASQKNFDNNLLSNVIENFPIDVDITYNIQQIEGKNWNEEWEKNYFEPLVIDEICAIKSSFHTLSKRYPYTITIDPKMAFGTGHHQTTELVIRYLLGEPLQGSKVLDMGCGTAILGILASMRGAASVKAIDIDPWAFNNAVENIERNEINNISLHIGDVGLIANDSFEVIVANINRNVLLADIPIYAKALSAGGALIMSGFYQDDLRAIQDKCKEYKLEFDSFNEKENWVAAKFVNTKR